MIWLCGNCSFEFYKIDTDNVQNSLREAYNDSQFLNAEYQVSSNSKLTLKEYPCRFDTFVDGRPAESFFKIKRIGD